MDATQATPTAKKTIDLWSFEDASPELREKIIEKHRDINTDMCSYWYESVIEQNTEELQKLGFEDADINFSGFCSQGDGASFNCTVNIDQFIKSNKLEVKYGNVLACKDGSTVDYSCKITNGGHYCHEMTMGIDTDIYTPEEDRSAQSEQFSLGQLEDLLLQSAREEAKRIYKELEAEYEYLNSDEAVSEMLIANEYLFDENGDIQ